MDRRTAKGTGKRETESAKRIKNWDSTKGVGGKRVLKISEK
jgi:hypothetical protein